MIKIKSPRSIRATAASTQIVPQSDCQIAENPARPVFPVRQHHARPARRNDIKPSQQIGLAGVGAETAERMDFRLYRDFFAEDPDELVALDQPPAQCAGALTADDDDVRRRLPEVRLEVMQDVRPPLDIPALAMTRQGPGWSLIFFESSAVTHDFSDGKSSCAGF